uniref:Signal peptide peptidase-like 3 n=1 Tax=Trichuris muris TaxID=70415 RepID=A0A5S6QQY2_TRIMR
MEAELESSLFVSSAVEGAFWASGLLDFSRMSTFIFALLLIIYGSIRSLSYDEAKKQSERFADAEVINGRCALTIPIFGSIFLLISYFFESLHFLIFTCAAVVVTVACAFLFLPLSESLLKPCSDGHRISFGLLGRYTAAEILSLFTSLTLLFAWLMTGHWLLMDALAVGLSVSFIALVRLPSLKVSTLLLLGLLIYDLFWVFFSSYLFQTNVMLYVASKTAENPIAVVSRKFHFVKLINDPPKLSLPAKLMFPSLQDVGSFTILGLGDVVMPASATVSGFQKVTYFHCSLIGYFFGLLSAAVFSEVFKTAQPALLYLVPFTLLPLVVMAYLKGDLYAMWSEPFQNKDQAQLQVV